MTSRAREKKRRTWDGKWPIRCFPSWESQRNISRRAFNTRASGSSSVLQVLNQEDPFEETTHQKEDMSCQHPFLRA